jgi:DNA ligase (NAD+)
MAPRRVAREAAELAERLRKLQYEYYVLGMPTASDADYDALFDRLLVLEREHPEIVSPDSPTQRVGSDLSSDLPEVHHTIPVLSLDKAYDAAEVGAWMRKTSQSAGRPLGYVFEEKIDGAAVVLYYEKGRLLRAVTRGNGIVGNDVTANVRTIGSVPLVLSRSVDLTVRGEIYLPRPLFDRINAAMEVPYANPRNLAAGTLRRVKSSEVARIPLDIFVYEGFAADLPATHVHVLEELASLGFRLNGRIGFFAGEAATDRQIEETRGRHPSWMVGRTEEFERFLDRERTERPSLSYDIDGIVIKADDMTARAALGMTGHHPKWALAYKFDAPESVTVVTAIDIQVGRTGRVTPVARVEPVRISGSTVSNVTLHNQEYVDLLELSVGDTVAVSKRGDIIPAVERVLEKAYTEGERAAPIWKMPPACPSCGTGLTRIGAHTFCTNAEGCPAQIRGRLAFFVARDQMDIENLGPETIDVLVERELLHDVPDIYALDTARLLDLPGFGEKKVALIAEGIEHSKKRPFRVVLPSLGIPELGQKVTELLADAGFHDIDSLLRVADSRDPAPLLAIHGIGEKTADRIMGELSRPEVRARIERLRAAGLQLREEPPAGGRADGNRPAGPFAGTVWCVTGSFRTFQPRELAVEEIRKRGGRVVASVSGATTHLLAGESPGGKLAKARELGAAIVDEDAFLAMLRP